jgi:hypothetical protein
MRAARRSGLAELRGAHALVESFAATPAAKRRGWQDPRVQIPRFALAGPADIAGYAAGTTPIRGRLLRRWFSNHRIRISTAARRSNVRSRANERVGGHCKYVSARFEPRAKARRINLLCAAGLARRKNLPGRYGQLREILLSRREYWNPGRRGNRGRALPEWKAHTRTPSETRNDANATRPRWSARYHSCEGVFPPHVVKTRP